MRRIFVFVLVFLMLPLAWAEQSYRVVDPDSAMDDWLNELPGKYVPVLERIAAQNPAAAKAKTVYIYPEGDACWVFCRTKADVYHAGTFWYVDGDTAYALGGSSDVWNWDYFPGEGVFFCSLGEPENRTVNAAIAVDGAPVLLEVPDSVETLYGWAGGSILCGLMDVQPYDYAFLTVKDGELCEVRASALDPAAFLAMTGGKVLISDVTEWYGEDCVLTSCLYRSTGAITLNFDDGGTARHVYTWMTDEGIQTQTGWEGEPALLDGEGSACRDIGLRIVTSVEG